MEKHDTKHGFSLLAGVDRDFAAEGLNKEELLSGCGLLTADLENPARRFPSTLTALLWTWR